MLVKEKGVSGAPGISVQANTSWNKTHHEFEADGRLSAPNCEKTSRQFCGGYSKHHLAFEQACAPSGAHLGQETALNPENKPHFRLSRAAAGWPFRSAAARNGAVLHAISNKLQARPLVRSGGEGVPTAPTAALLNHPRRDVSTSARRGPTKLAWQHLRELVWKCDRGSIGFLCRRCRTDQFCR